MTIGDVAKPPDWMLQGVCAQVGATADHDLWFPPLGYNGREAKKVCAGCPVRDECLEYALGGRETQGVWGGLSSRQRQTLARERTAA